MSGAHNSKTNTLNFPEIICSKNDLEFVLDFCKVSWCLQRGIIGFGLMDTFESPEIMEMRGSRVSEKLKQISYKQIEKLQVPIEAE